MADALYSARAAWPLHSLNFFMADMQAGIGPFLGVFLLAHGWQSGPIGSVMTIGGIAGMLMTVPAGALIDRTTNKRLYVIVPGICTVLASFLILLSQSFWVVAGSQVATAIAGAAIVPAVTGISPLCRENERANVKPECTIEMVLGYVFQGGVFGKACVDDKDVDAPLF